MPGISRIFFLLCAAILLLNGCSGDSEKEEPGAIDRLTSRVADEAVQNIRQPMEQTKEQMQAIQAAHMQAVDDAVHETR